MSKVYVIVRTINEKSFNRCIKAVEERDFKYSVVRDYIPLEKATKRLLEMGGEMEDYDWIMALDADVILTASKRKIEDFCGEMENVYKNIFCFTTWVNDTKRGIIPGVHFYRRTICGKAYSILKDISFHEKPSRKGESEMVYYLHKYKHFRRVVSEHEQLIIGKHIWEVNN